MTLPVNRTVNIPGIWADGATDIDLTPNPTPLTTYKKPGVTSGEANAAWPFAKVVDSAVFNEMLYRITSLLALAEKYGILTWDIDTEYVVGSVVLGKDGNFYQCKADSQGDDPTEAGGDTYWVVDLGMAKLTKANTFTASQMVSKDSQTTSVDAGLVSKAPTAGDAGVALVTASDAAYIKKTAGAEGIKVVDEAGALVQVRVKDAAAADEAVTKGQLDGVRSTTTDKIYTITHTDGTIELFAYMQESVNNATKRAFPEGFAFPTACLWASGTPERSGAITAPGCYIEPNGLFADGLIFTAGGTYGDTQYAYIHAIGY